MMPMLFIGPRGDLPSERQTTAKPPENHSHVSVPVTFPPGPMGLGFISPSVVHLPTKYSRRLCSGPGLGGAPGACATAFAANAAIDTTIPRTSRTVLLFIGTSN